jgi:hypothetical protein
MQAMSAMHLPPYAMPLCRAGAPAIMACGSTKLGFDERPIQGFFNIG